MSNSVAVAADSLSRKSMTPQDLLTDGKIKVIPPPRGALIQWLSDPFLDWDLPLKLVEDIKRKL
jgi:hypothetical protein